MAKKRRRKKKLALVVKRRGHREEFDERKAYGSIYWACATCHLGERECEKLAAKVVKKLKIKISKRKEVNSTEIFGLIVAILAKHNEDAAFMYEAHRDIS